MKEREEYPYSEITHKMRQSEIITECYYRSQSQKLSSMSLTSKTHEEFLEKTKVYCKRLATIALVGHWFSLIATLGLILLWKNYREYLTYEKVYEQKLALFHKPFTHFFKPRPVKPAEISPETEWSAKQYRADLKKKSQPFYDGIARLDAKMDRLQVKINEKKAEIARKPAHEVPEPAMKNM